MEWIETSAKSVEEAKDILLDQLGVDESDTEFEVLEEPKPGLFGRTKGQARVRARVRPKTPPSRDDRRRRPARGRGKSGDIATAAADAPASDDTASESVTDAAPVRAATATVEREQRPAQRARNDARSDGEDAGPRLDSDVAAAEATKFLQELVAAFELSATVGVVVDEGGDLAGEISGDGLGRLIGPRGGVISALEELTRTRLQHVASGGSTPRFRLDVGGYRAARRPNLELLVDDVVEQVRSTGRPHVLDVVVAGERKLVHDRIAEVASDLRTHSEGEDPVRRVVVSPT